MNEAMRRKLESGAALDVESMIELATPEPDPMLAGTWRLDRFVDDRDYCVRSSERWIWSIGRRRRDGAIFAALDSRFYGHPEFECVWLR